MLCAVVWLPLVLTTLIVMCGQCGSRNSHAIVVSQQLCRYACETRYQHTPCDGFEQLVLIVCRTSVSVLISSWYAFQQLLAAV